MIKMLKQKIASYFIDKTLTKINEDPVGCIMIHFGTAIEMLKIYGKIETIFWLGSYEYDLKIIEYFRKQEKISIKNIELTPFNKYNDGELIIEILLGKGSDGIWFLAFFCDSLDLYKKISLLDSFRIMLEDENQLISSGFSKII